MAKDDPLRLRLASVKPASKGQGPSPARSRIRDTFDAMTAARKRGVTWAQITELLTADGIRATDDAPLTVDEVRALFHAERQLRLSRQSPRKTPAKATAAPAPSPVRPEVPEPPPGTPTRPEVVPPAPPPPAPAANPPANPWAEIDRRSAEAKRRRDQIAAAKEWNPYATPKEKPE